MIQTARRGEFDELSRQSESLVDRLWDRHFQQFCPPDAWAPAINLYRFERRIEVCVDLAGVETGSIEVRVETGRLVIRGVRAAPEPVADEQETMHIVAMEIDHGSFRRIVNLPDNVEHIKTKTRYANGLLWIQLPLRDVG